MATKRKAELGLIQDQDPDYETVSVMTASKRQRLFEKDAKDITVKKIEGIIKRQFAIEMRHKEKEVELIDERIHQARAMLDKLRACIMANYYGNIGLSQSSLKGEKSRSVKSNLNHPAIQRALKNRLKASSPSETPDQALVEGIAPDSTTHPSVNEVAIDVASTPSSGHWSGQQSERSSPESEQLSRVDLAEVEEEPNAGGWTKGPRNSGPDTFGVGPPLLTPKPCVSQVDSGEGSRFHVKKRIIVGNVSKYIPPENREDSDPSTHKWMVYVRGPPEEPRIDHFVKRIWFFLHPSYRPNDLVEVKEPPFHLTRRGWGEFPIRIQLHFLDPRNKKVDIIHPLKLDRTYTGLQTLGAETIVDVELDRYLFDDHGQPLSRPMTPTITKVNYQEGIKPGSPGTSWDEARWKGTSPRRATPHDRLQEEPGISHMTGIQRSESLEESPARGTTGDETNQKVEQRIDQTSDEGAASVEQGHSFSGVIGPAGIQPSSQAHPIGVASMGQIAVQQRQGGQFVRVMPPLGPITKSALMAPSSLGSLSQKGPGPSASPAKVVTPTEEKSGSIIGSLTSSQPSSANVSPTLSGVINVADAAFTGKGTLDVRIQEGKVIQDVTSPTQDVPQSKAEVLANVMPPGILPLQQAPVKTTTVLPTTAPSKAQNVQGALVTTALQKLSQVVESSVLGACSQAGGNVVQPTSSQLNKPVMSTTSSTTSAGVPAVKRIPSSGSITVIPSRSPTESPKLSPPASASGIPTPPPGTQYYITAKSTDPNLQGKVILIPQQVFQQASSQQAIAAGKQGAGKVSSPAGKVGASKAAASSKSPFLSPSNVLILPAGSIVPPLPPGSIVQIQQVPSPVRSTPASGQPKSQTASAVTKAVAAPGKTTGAKITGLPSGGVIQIQRTAGTTMAKVAGVQGPSQGAGISILPDQKGQLAKTPSGGVVFVQRTPSGGKISSGQTLARLPLVQGSLALQQKITLAAQLPPGAVPLSQGPLTLKPGSSVNILQNPTPKTLQGQTLVLHAQPSTLSLSKIQGKPHQAVTTVRQPIVSGGQPSKFIIQGQGSKVVTQGQLQVRLSSAPRTSATAPRPVAATSTPLVSAEPKTVMIAQVSGDGKLGLGAAVSTARGSALKKSDAEVQEIEGSDAIASQSSEKEIDIGSSSVAKEPSKIKSADNSSQEVAVIKEQIKETTTQQVVISEAASATGTGASATTDDARLAYSAQHEPTKAVGIRSIPPKHLPRIVIKQEPITSPQKDFPLASTIQGTMNPTSATSDVQVKIEAEEKESDVSILMRELGMSCLEGPVSVYGLQTMEELIRAVVKKTPLINKDRVQSEHPFTATSIQHYHSWSGAKRRSAEWHRAISVRRIASEAREKSERLRFERMWTTKEVMVWCRQRGYTPPEPGIHEANESWCSICGDLCKMGRKIQLKVDEHDCRNNWLSPAGLLKPISYTTPDEIANSLQTKQATIEQSFSDNEAEIDVIGVWDPRHRMQIKRELPEAQDGIRCYLPLSDGAKMTQEIAQQIGVCFKPIQLAQDTFAPVVEEVMFSAVSQFIDTLLRESLAKAYSERTDNRLPKEILPTHVLQAINGIKSCDFLSNRHLGVLAMATEDNQEAAS